MDAAATFTWAPPEFNLSRQPALAPWAGISEPFPHGDFPRSAKWCADGAAVLAQCEQRQFRLYSSDADTARAVSQPGPILDYAWYPTASPANPAAFCFVASVRETPVKLLDASDGRLRASYPIVDHRERQVAPHCLAFNMLGTRSCSSCLLYCGFEHAIEVFDIGRPGPGTRLPTSPSKKSRDGLKGIISALAFSPSYDSDFYAAGSLAATSGNIALFSGEEAVPTHYVDGGPAAGVTQLHFNPMRPHILYAAFRRRRALYSWDLRADTGTPLRVYASTPRGDDPHPSDTYQKRRFDVEIGGRFLGVGDQEGNVSIFDLSSEVDAAVDTTAKVPISTPCLTYKAHKDAIGGIAFHPTKPALLSVSGSRHFDMDESGSSSSSEEDLEDLEGDARSSGLRSVRHPTTRAAPLPRDASMKLWDLGVEFTMTDI
ncbi:WD40-repeat-containing domain protein [Mycena pura]|uniref:WD40-repeat-containing domain protein n=1 Tax=Mycena pura TaxID=153505 RepID=A0AAD6UP28_9AGAR|nr:WD40-repeat-containing domain protein [Mycena pura]